MKRPKTKPHRKIRAKKKTQPPETQIAVKSAPATDPGTAALQIREILDRLFDGNAAQIVKTLAESGELTAEETARMKEVFRKAKRGGR